VPIEERPELARGRVLLREAQAGADRGGSTGNGSRSRTSVIRPGSVYGPGKHAIAAGSASTPSGSPPPGRAPINSVHYVDQLREASPGRAGPGRRRRVFNVVDDDLPSSRRFLRLYKRNVTLSLDLRPPRRESRALLRREKTRTGRGTAATRVHRRRWHALLEADALHQRQVEEAARLDNHLPMAEACGVTSRAAARAPCLRSRSWDAADRRRARRADQRVAGGDRRVCDREPLMARQLSERFRSSGISAT